MDGGLSERELPATVLQSILQKCDHDDVASAACVDRHWRSIASDDHVWKFFCARKFDLSFPDDHHGNRCSSYKEAYKLWHANFQNYSSPLVIRAKKCWDSLKSWASSNSPEMAKSLLPGVSEADLAKFEEKLGLKLPLAVRVLYRFCGGQGDLNGGEDSDEEESADGDYAGLFGGYSFYDHAVDVHFLSLIKVLLLTRHLIPQWGNLEEARKWVVIAASLSWRKFFLLDCKDGSLHVGTSRLASHGEMMSCVPPSTDGGSMEDSMLRWLEVYCSRLHTGIYTLQNSGIYGDDDFEAFWSVSLYPELPPLCSEAISYGVQVRSSAVFVPEYSSVEKEDYMFTYLIRMRLLAANGNSHVSTFDSCQLASRHWIIREQGLTIDEVRGPAVIGKYPLLRTGGPTFMYTSCSQLRVRNGSIEGDFTFVPGSLNRPGGPPFLVKVPEFSMEVPSFIY